MPTTRATTVAAGAAAALAGATAATLTVRALYRGRFTRADRIASALRAADRADYRRELVAILDLPLTDAAACARRIHAQDQLR